MPIPAVLLQVQRLQQDQVRLEQAATEQINAALQEGLAAAAAAREEAEAGGSSVLQEALEREAQLTAGITDLQAEHEVSSLKCCLETPLRLLCLAACAEVELPHCEIHQAGKLDLQQLQRRMQWPLLCLPVV